MELDTLVQRYESCCRTIRNLQGSAVVRQDCVRMSRSTHKLLENVSRASVECRRLGKPTAQYQKTIEQAQESVHNLERYVMLAQLMT
jgi:hypothetical protein